MLGALALTHRACQVLDRLPGYEQPSSESNSRDLAAMNGGIGLVSPDSKDKCHLPDRENQSVRK